MPQGPEDIAREQIDRMLIQSGWAVQDAKAVNLYAKQGVAIREFELKSGFGTADYLLYVDGRAAGVIEAKKAGSTLTGVEIQSAKYSKGLPDALPAWTRPLPFCYQSTGIETRFTNGFDPEPCSRQVFFFHKPEIFAAWLTQMCNPSSRHPDLSPLSRHSRPDRESRDVAVEPLDPRLRGDDVSRDIKTRQHLMERSFARGTRYGFDQARWRGLWRMRVQEYLTCAIQNIQVLITHASKPKQAAAAQLLVVQRAEVKAFGSLRLGATLRQHLQLLTVGSKISLYQRV
jgi:hypothetical protein